MQATNLAVVDRYLEEFEDQMVAEYITEDRTPFPITTVVSAFSELWIFGLYELLRTWKQWMSELINHGEKLAKLESQANASKLKKEFIERRMKHLEGTIAPDDPYYPESFRKVERDPQFRADLTSALDLVLPLFRRLEALRVTLAKHEVPKGRGVRAFAPGYARIDSLNNCLVWFVKLPNGYEDMISRRWIAEACCALHKTPTKFPQSN